MPDNPTLKAESRKITGRKIKRLRRQGLIPANVYGKKIKSLCLQLPTKDFRAALAKVGETGILNLVVSQEAKPRPVLIHEVQIQPLTEEILHVDFRQVDLSEKVTVKVPVETVGTAPAVTKGGVLIQLIHELEVEALPRDLPDKFTVDVSKLEEIGQGISLKEIKLDTAKVKLLAENLEELVVKIEEPTKEEEKPTEAAPAAPAEAPKPEVKKEELKAEKK